MNFKRLRGIYAVALITIAAALFAGCMNSMAGSVSGNERGVAVLHLSATGIPDEYAEEFAAYNKRQNGRSILPDDPFDIGNIGDNTTQSETLTFVLTGTSETGKKYGPQTVVLIKKADNSVDTDGDALYDLLLNITGDQVTMDAMSWSLTLTGYKGPVDATAQTNPVLIGYSSVDLRKGSGTVTFKLGIAGLTTPGTVNITGTIVDVDNLADHYTVGIYRKDNGKDVGGTEVPVTGFNAGANPAFTYNANGLTVPPGSYNYTMIFYNAGNEVVGYWEETIVINPGNALNATREIKCIGSRPTEPKNLMAFYLENATSPSSDGSTYQVKVTWGASNYVTNYELNVVESPTDGADLIANADTDSYLDTDGLIPDGHVYGMASMDKTGSFVEEFPGSKVFGGIASSSMMSDDTSCIITLETGKVYDIQLRARSYLGVSKWVNRMNATGAGANETPYNASDDENDPQRINLVRLRYNLNGGQLKLGTEGSRTGLYTEYKCWKSNAPLLAISTADPVPDTDNSLAIYDSKGNSGARWAAWLLEDGTAVDDDNAVLDANETHLDNGVNVANRGSKVTQYTYKNATVKASFGNSVTGNVSQEGKIKDIDPSDISVYTRLPDGTDSIDVTRDLSLGDGCLEYTLEKNVNGKYIVTVTLDKVLGATPIYKNVKYEAWLNNTSTKRVLDVIGSNSCTVNTADYGSGMLTVKITADTAQARELSWSIVFDVK